MSVESKDSFILVVLVGGKGSRLSSIVSDAPKPLAHVKGKPFLGILLDIWSARCALKKVYLLSGHMAQQISKFADNFEFGCPIQCLEEQEPLGTGGALANFFATVKDEIAPDDRLVISNGDTAFDYFGNFKQDFSDLIVKSGAVGILTSAELVEDRDERLCVGRDNVVFDIAPPGKGVDGQISAGVYFSLFGTLQKLTCNHQGCFSFERECLPLMVKNKTLIAYERCKNFIDFGTPSSYAEIQKLEVMKH